MYLESVENKNQHGKKSASWLWSIVAVAALRWLRSLGQ